MKIGPLMPQAIPIRLLVIHLSLSLMARFALERSESPIDLFDVTFTNNTGNAIQTSGEYSHVTLEKAIFSGNSSAVYMTGDAFATLDNCVIHDNSGIGVITTETKSLITQLFSTMVKLDQLLQFGIASNSIIYGNNPNELMQVYCGNNLDAQYSVIQGVYSYGINSNPNDETLINVLTDDPNLDSNGYLMEGSIAIDAAMPWEHDHIMPPGLEGVTRYGCLWWS